MQKRLSASVCPCKDAAHQTQQAPAIASLIDQYFVSIDVLGTHLLPTVIARRRIEIQPHEEQGPVDNKRTSSHD